MLHKTLAKIAQTYFNSEKIDFKQIKADGSDKVMFKISHHQYEVLGVFFKDTKANKRFIKYARYFDKLGLPVPKILAVSEDFKSYLTSYLGDKNLAAMIKKLDKASLVSLYQDIIPWSDVFYKKGKDLMHDYQKRVFDENLYQNDWDYFYKNFVKYLKLDSLAHKNFDLTAKKLIKNLSSFPNEGFVHRDFQVRNFIRFKNKLWFIDFQDGMLGPRYYDLASLLFGSSSQLDFDTKKLLWVDYFKKTPQNTKKALDQFLHMALIRKLRSLGTYTKLGMLQKRQSFKKPLANLVKEAMAIGEVKNDYSNNLSAIYPDLFIFLQKCSKKV